MDRLATRDLETPPLSADGTQRIGPFQVRLDVVFDQHSYALTEDTVARFLVEVELGRADDELRGPLATEARLVVEFMDGIGPGDAWVYRPLERHFGPVVRPRNVYSLGPVEAGTKHALAFEMGLPATMSSPTLVAKVACVWQHDRGVSQCKGTVYAGRSAAPDTTMDDRHLRVLRVFTMLNAIRDLGSVRRKLEDERAKLTRARTDRRNPIVMAGLEKNISILLTEERQVLFSTESARLALARVEGQDPAVIAAIEQQIALLEQQHASARGES